MRRLFAYRLSVQLAVFLVCILGGGVLHAQPNDNPARSAEYAEPIEYLKNDIPRRERAQYELFELYGEKALPKAFRIPANTTMVYGIDISHWQGNINWDLIPKGTVIFAFIKATEGSRYADPSFATHWPHMAEQRKAALAQGSHFFRGAYHFFSAQVDPAQQAEHFIRMIGQLVPGDLPPVLDLEWDWVDQNTKIDRWDDLGREERLKRIKTWLARVEQALGRTPIIYTNYHFWRDKLGEAPELTRHPLWIADYSFMSRSAEKPVHLPGPFKTWQLWQFTDRGEVEGMEGGVDINRFNGTLQEIRALVGE